LSLRATRIARHSWVNSLSDYDVIHFATHGLFDQNALSDAALVLTPISQSDSFNDGILSASEIARLSLQARLVVLSACNSAKFKQQQANLGVHDLQAAFTVAGAPTILAALWPVESTISAKLIEEFFKNWRSGRYGGAAQSLAQTIRIFLDNADIPHQHPRFWAPFEIFGNGSITGEPSQAASKKLRIVRPLPEFSSGGEVTSATHLGPNVFLSLIAEWDGKRMARIISKRDLEGHELWRYTSREIGGAPIAISNENLFALGYKGKLHFVPVIQLFDPQGHLLWTKEFTDLTDYTFVGLVPSRSGIFVVAYPTFTPPSAKQDAYLERIDLSGKEIQRASFKVDTSLFPSATSAVIQIAGDRLVVALNHGTSYGIDPKRKSVLGWPLICVKGASAELLELDAPTLKLINTSSIDRFFASSIVIQQKDLFVGGEQFDHCSQTGTAAVVKLQPNRPAQTF
jgi:hypothetical protein